ncbi:MAG TPA: FecR family protein, partial [Usitatibacteraceae bacterium]|nr:FecR family protein [Usitatibacteraceae bacterium]
MNRFLRIFTLVLTLATATAAVAQTPIGRVLVASGEVELLRGGRAERALAGSGLQPGDRVRTGTNANAQLWFIDESIVALRHGSEFVIESFRFERKAESDSLSFSLLRGGLRTLAGMIGAANPMGYRVNTPMATLGRRGTQYAVVACQDDCAADGSIANGLYGGVFEGNVTIANNTGVSEFSYGQYFFVRDPNSVPQPLLGPPAVLADRLLGLGKGIAPAAPAAQETAQATAEASTSGVGGNNTTASTAPASATPANTSGTTSTTQSSTATTAPTTSAAGTATVPGLTGGSTTSGSTSAQGTSTVAPPPVAPFTGTSTLGSGGTPAALPSGAAPTPTLGLSAAWFITPPIIFLEDTWGRTMFAAPATLQLTGSGSAERLTGFSVYLADTLNVAAQTTVSETLTASLALGTIDMTGYDGAANVHWGRWVDGQLYKSNKPPGAHMPLSGVHYIYGNPTPDTVIAAKSGSFNFNDVGGTIATDSTGALGTGGFGAINVNFTNRSGSISSVNYAFPTATYTYSNLPFLITLVPGAGAWMGADIASGGTCTGSGCTSPGTGNAGAVFNGIFFGSSGNFLGLSFHGSSGGH